MILWNVEQIDDLCNSLIDSCMNAANATIPSYKPKYNIAKEVTDWSDEVVPAHHRWFFWHWIWIESGKTRSGLVHVSRKEPGIDIIMQFNQVRKQTKN